MAFGADPFGTGSSEGGAVVPPPQEGLERSDNVLALRPVTLILPAAPPGFTVTTEGDPSAVTDQAALAPALGRLPDLEYEAAKLTYLTFKASPGEPPSYWCGVEILLDQPEWIDRFIYYEGSTKDDGSASGTWTQPDQSATYYLEPVKNEWQGFSISEQFNFGSDHIARFRPITCELNGPKKIKGLRVLFSFAQNYHAVGDGYVEAEFGISEFQALRPSPLPPDYVIESITPTTPTTIIVVFGEKFRTFDYDVFSFKSEYFAFDGGLVNEHAIALYYPDTAGDIPYVRRRVTITTSPQVPNKLYRLTVNDMMQSINDEVLPVNYIDFLGFSPVAATPLGFTVRITVNTLASRAAITSALEDFVTAHALDTSIAIEDVTAYLQGLALTGMDQVIAKSPTGPLAADGRWMLGAVSFVVVHALTVVVRLNSDSPAARTAVTSTLRSYVDEAETQPLAYTTSALRSTLSGVPEVDDVPLLMPQTPLPEPTDRWVVGSVVFLAMEAGATVFDLERGIAQGRILDETGVTVYELGHAARVRALATPGDQHVISQSAYEAGPFVRAKLRIRAPRPRAGGQVDQWLFTAAREGVVFYSRVIAGTGQDVALDDVVIPWRGWEGGAADIKYGLTLIGGG